MLHNQTFNRMSKTARLFAQFAALILLRKRLSALATG